MPKVGIVAGVVRLDAASVRVRHRGIRRGGMRSRIDCITDEGGFECGGGKSEGSFGAGPSGLLATEMTRDEESNRMKAVIGRQSKRPWPV